MATFRSVSGLNPLYPEGQKGLTRRHTVPMILDLGPSPHCLKASEAESLVFGREEEFFCVQRDENKHRDQELCPASPCLEGTQSQVGTTPAGCS